MNIDIEAMAKEADPAFEYLLSDGLLHLHELKAFTRLIVERCAVEWESQHGFDKHGAADAIRNLLED